MKTIDTITQEIIAEFEQFDSVDEKYIHLFTLGDSLAPMDPSLKIEANRVQGCQSKLWFQLQWEDDHFHLQADSDSSVIKAISALLVRVVDNIPPGELQDLNLEFIDALNIWKLASERNNGLVAMLAHLKHQASELMDQWLS
ncbi:MAG: SufE family protein [Anaerolineaceae bacterium]|nr:SufE family protein [Anaerolineaceae bacterium]